MLEEPRPTEDAPRPGPLARGLLVLVRGYRTWISPVLPPSCRFEPSCSAYALEALSTHGALRGTWLTIRRLLRCGPWHPGGWDPVPPKRTRLPTEVAVPEATTERATTEGTRLWWTPRTDVRSDEPENAAHHIAAEE